jgi:signal transduction histidine kinase
VTVELVRKVRGSIITQVTLLVAAILILSVLVTGGVALAAQRRWSTRSLEAKASGLVQFMAEVSPLGVLSLNFVQMRNDVRKVVLTDDEVVYALILNEHGTPLAYFFKEPGPAPATEVGERLAAHDALAARALVRRSGRILEVAAPILAGEVPVGSAVLGLTFDGMDRALRVQLALMALVLVIIMAVSVLVLKVVLRRSLHPVETLTAAAERIRAGDLDVVLTGTDRADELGILSRAFANMANQLRGLIGGLEQRVTERTSQLEAANKELEAFSYSVSHDLRAPLRHIGGYVELLRNRSAGSLDGQSQHYMDAISEAAIRMGALADDLLAFSRMGRAELVRASVDVGALVREVIDELGPDITGRAIDWKVGAFPPVSADRQMLRLAITNLLSNAVKFTRSCPRAEIEIACTEPPGGAEVVISVRDNGVGFDMRYVDKLFKVFQRLHRPEDFEGTGIGLANVRRIVERHGGRTWAVSTPGEGATFSFSLPIQRSQA